MNGIINEAQLAATLNAQILVRDQKITKEQAIEGLKQARRRQIAVEVPLMEKGFYTVQPRESVRLGELLTLSGMVSESQILSAVELGLVSENPGQSSDRTSLCLRVSFENRAQNPGARWKQALSSQLRLLRSDDQVHRRRSCRYRMRWHQPNK
ncbi:MAG: hypothetical protein R3C24_05700 [Cyanobacteriota/Melainabacteria group bacterium]